jgi:hypothetical protein
MRKGSRLRPEEQCSVGKRKTSIRNRSGPAEGPMTSSRGESHCYNCGKTDHWVHDCPHLSNKQQQQLHIHLESKEGADEQKGEAHQLMHVMLAQGVALPDNRGYLDGYSTVTAFKCKKYLKGVKKHDTGSRSTVTLER